MIRLVRISSYFIDSPGVAEDLTWKLLLERDDSQNISHNTMPTRKEHDMFVRTHSYWRWMVIENEDGIPVGTINVTDRNEIGIFILKEYQGKGYGKAAVKEMISTIKPAPAIKSVRPVNFVANINPMNKASIAFFESLGAKHIQNTYVIPNQEGKQ